MVRQYRFTGRPTAIACADWHCCFLPPFFLCHHPQHAQFLVSWLIVLQNVPGISFLPFLPKFLHGLLKIVDDPNKQIQDMSVEVLHEIVKEITRVRRFFSCFARSPRGALLPPRTVCAEFCSTIRRWMVPKHPG